jgi:hypothetical protein
MGDEQHGRGHGASPYSRTGLFPWGSTYQVPVRVHGHAMTTHTPCHVRSVDIASDHADRRHRVRCATCGRAWIVSITLGSTPRATWTA